MFFEVAAIGTLTDEYQVCILSQLAELPVSRGNELQVLLDADPSNIDELSQSLLIFNSVFFPVAGRAVTGMKTIDVDPTVEKENLSFPETAFVKEFGSGSRWDDHFVDCMIERHHVLPRECFKADVPCVILDILGNVGVVRRRSFDLKCFRRQQCRKPHRSGGADLDLRCAFFLQIPEEFEKRRKANLKSVVFGKVQIGDGGEYFEPARVDKSSNLRFGAVLPLLFPTQASDHREFNTAPHGFSNHSFDADRHSIHFEERIRQQCDPAGLGKLKRFANVTCNQAVRRLLKK